MFEREGHGQYRKAPTVNVVSIEFEKVRANVNQFHTFVTLQNSYHQTKDPRTHRPPGNVIPE